MKPLAPRCSDAAAHDAAADAGAERDEQRVRHSGRGAVPPLGLGRARRVVVDRHRDLQAIGEQVADRHLGRRRQVRRGAQHARAIDEPGRADADRGDAAAGVRGERLDDLGHGVDEVRRTAWRRHAFLDEHRAVDGEADAEALGAADVDAGEQGWLSVAEEGTNPS